MKKYFIYYSRFEYGFESYLKAKNKFRAIRKAIRLYEKTCHHKGYMIPSDIKYITIKEITKDNLIIGE